MFNEIKKLIDKELSLFAKELDKTYHLNRISPALSKNIKSFILSDGKRSRPILFITGYLGFAKKISPAIYRSSLAIELLHDFMLIHDDIIDKSDTRRGKPSMHKMLEKLLRGKKNLKFSGTDLAIVIGDCIYALALDTFLSIKEPPLRKELALKKFAEAAMFTGGGEFIELLLGTKDLEKIKKEDIYKIYNYKTAYYSFTSPLSIGAILGGANQKQIEIISKYGLYLGNAFQIKDDILGMFSEETKIGKSTLCDLQEAKKTILIWYAYKNSSSKLKALIKRIMTKKIITKADLLIMRKIVISSGAKVCAEKEISRLLNQAQALIQSSAMRPKYKNLLYNYSKEIL